MKWRVTIPALFMGVNRSIALFEDHIAIMQCIQDIIDSI